MTVTQLRPQEAAILAAIRIKAQRRALERAQGELATTYRWRGTPERPGLARKEQILPDGDWWVWLIQTGRGWGKTRTGAEAVREMVEGRTIEDPVTGESKPMPNSQFARARRIALVGETAADVRDVMIEGESGILACSPPGFRPVYEPTKRRLTWPNGAIATSYSAEDPEQLRGPQHEFAWVDEVAKWRYPRETWDNLMFGLRLGKNPRVVATTTPRPIQLIRDLQKQPGVIVTRGSTFDNEANLAPVFLQEITARYEGTRTGRQELFGELLEDVEGALWARRWIDEARVRKSEFTHEELLDNLTRVIVGLDPSGLSEGGAQQGIVVAGFAGPEDGRPNALCPLEPGHSAGCYFVLEAKGHRLPPAGWAKAAITAFDEWQADKIVAEKNYGGEMVAHTLRQVNPAIPLKIVSASRGKVARAEPIAALYEQGRVHHLGVLDELEDQQCVFPVGGGLRDLIDASVWALSELASSKRRLRAV